MVDEARGELAGVDVPDRKKREHIQLSEVFFTIGAQIAQENIAESKMAYSAVAEAQGSLRHPGFVKRIGALGRYADFRQRQTDGVRLQA